MIIFSLNVWFSNYLKKERTQILTEYILNNQFDIIMFQEATPYALSSVYKVIHDIYPFIHIDVDDNFYGTCIISKHKIKEKKILKFKNTRMRRGVIYCKINDIIFATTHLESEFGKNQNKKVDQFNNTIKLLSQFDKVVLIGDTNLTPKNDEHLMLEEFKDVYLEIDNSKENKYTYDGKENPLLKNKLRSRVDRALCKNIDFTKFNLEKEIIMSDHYGVILNIS